MNSTLNYSMYVYNNVNWSILELLLHFCIKNYSLIYGIFFFELFGIIWYLLQYTPFANACKIFDDVVMVVNRLHSTSECSNMFFSRKFQWKNVFSTDLLFIFYQVILFISQFCFIDSQCTYISYKKRHWRAKKYKRFVWLTKSVSSFGQKQCVSRQMSVSTLKFSSVLFWNRQCNMKSFCADFQQLDNVSKWSFNHAVITG